MIHYTILPFDIIFEEDNLDLGNKPKQRVIEMDGVSFVVEPSTESDTEFKIVQLISTDPNHFLNEQYQPGQMLALKPSIG